MNRLLHALYARRDAAVVVTCAIGLAFVVLVLPALEDVQPQVVAQVTTIKLNQE